jgi:hypothetical protein
MPMHPYSTDSGERIRIPLILAVLAGLLAWALHCGLDYVDFPQPWWFEMPSFASFYGLLLAAFDQWVWRMQILARLGIVRTPHLGGIWTGHLLTNKDGFSAPHPARLMIHQTWLRIRIELETAQSRSASRSAAMNTIVPGEVSITYEYWNEPAAHAPNSMHAFRGTASQLFKTSQDQQSFDGEYYTGRDRQSFGTLSFRRSKAVAAK